jgi:hypothetical protein
MSDEKIIRPAEDVEITIPDGTPFVIVDLDLENKMVQVEFSHEGRVVRAWAPAASFEKMGRN